MIHKKLGARSTSFSLLALLAITLMTAGFLFTSCASSKAGKQELPTDPAIVSGKLDNGMSYFIQRNTEPANRIMLRLVIRVGSNMEEDDQQGVAHLLEHLAFNGSENFAANELIDYFETIGMNFGADVNAYTSFDETVYMLEVPADDPTMLDTGMLVLHDWACGLNLDQQELDKERGVVVEEWRLGRGLSGRINDAQIPFLLKDSRYAQRLPIGKMEVIQNVSRQRVVDFYEKWYRPELMSVVVVGDMEPDRIETLIQEVMGDIPASDASLVPETYTVTPQTEPALLVLRDPEQTYQLVQIMEQVETQPVTTVEQLRANIVTRIASSIMNLRFSELSQSAEAPWLDAAIASQHITNNTAFHLLGLIPRNGEFQRGFTTMMEEFLRFKKFGVLQSELERTRQNLMTSMEQTWKNRDKINSSTIASDIVSSITTGDTMISIDEMYRLYQEILPSITVKEVNRVAADWFKHLGTLLFAVVPQNAQDFPTDQQLFAEWQDFKPAQPLKPYTESSLEGDLIQKPSPEGSVTPEGTLPGTEVMAYSLSNGARLLLNKTDFKNNQILFLAVANGGLSTISDNEYPSGTVATTYNDLSGLNGFTPTELQKKLAGKNVSLYTYLGDYSQQLSGEASTNDLETLMQLIYLQFTAPDFTDTAWTNMLASLNQQAQGRGSKPDDVFIDEINHQLYGDTIRKAPLTPDYVEKLDKKQAEQVFRQSFADAANFTFIFTGDFDQQEVLELAATYLATLPATSTAEESLWREPDFPKGIKRSTVRKGLEDQSKVFIGFGGQLPPVDAATAYQDSEMLSMLKNLLDIRLREVVREDKSGTYNVGVNTSMILVPRRQFSVEIWFGCQPGREQELADIILDEIKQLRTELVDGSYVTKLQESYRRSKETALKNNSYWAQMIGSATLRGFPTTTITDTETIPGLVSPESLRELAQTYLDPTNYVLVILEPENR